MVVAVAVLMAAAVLMVEAVLMAEEVITLILIYFFKNNDNFCTFYRQQP